MATTPAGLCFAGAVLAGALGFCPPQPRRTVAANSVTTVPATGPDTGPRTAITWVPSRASSPILG